MGVFELIIITYENYGKEVQVLQSQFDMFTSIWYITHRDILTNELKKLLIKKVKI